MVSSRPANSTFTIAWFGRRRSHRSRSDRQTLTANPRGVSCLFLKLRRKCEFTSADIPFLLIGYLFDRHTTDMRSSVKVSRGRSAKSWGLRASVSFLPLSSPPHSLFLLSSHFARVQNCENRGFFYRRTPRKRLRRLDWSSFWFHTYIEFSFLLQFFIAKTCSCNWLISRNTI